MKSTEDIIFGFFCVPQNISPSFCETWPLYVSAHYTPTLTHCCLYTVCSSSKPVYPGSGFMITAKCFENDTGFNCVKLPCCTFNDGNLHLFAECCCGKHSGLYANFHYKPCLVTQDNLKLRHYQNIWPCVHKQIKQSIRIRIVLYLKNSTSCLLYSRYCQFRVFSKIYKIIIVIMVILSRIKRHLSDTSRRFELDFFYLNYRSLKEHVTHL